MIELSELQRALDVSHAVLREHEQDVATYLNQSPLTREVLRRAVSRVIDMEGLPTSRRVQHRTLMEMMNVGILIGVEIARGRIQEVEA